MTWIQAAALPVLAIAGAAAWTQPTVSGSDLWWHLASGREMVARGGVSQVDRFSHTFAGESWINHEWLWDLIFWSAFRVHPEWVAWLNLGVLLGVLALLYHSSQRLSGSRTAALLATWASAASLHWFFHIRPQMCTLLFIAVLLELRSSLRGRVFWPLLIAVWANIHSGFLFGLAAVALWTCVETARASYRARTLHADWRDWAVLGLCVLAPLLNPFGLEIATAPLAYLDPEAVYLQTVEWQPPGFALDPNTFRGRFTWLAFAWAASSVFLVRRDPFPVLLGAVALWMSVGALRFIPLFGIVAAPVIAVGLARAGTLAASRWPALRVEAVGWAGLAAALLVAVIVWQDVRLRPALLYRWTEGQLFPAAAVRYLALMPGSFRLFNESLWGGYLMLHADEESIFFDGRAHRLYDKQVYGDYLRIYETAPEFRALLHAYRIDAVLVSSRSKLASALSQGPDPWRVIYADPVAVIFVPPESSVRAPLPDESLADEPALRSALARRALRAGDLDSAERIGHEVIQEHPLFTPAYALLVDVYAERGDLDGIRAATELAIAAYPRAAPRLHVQAAGAYERVGYLARAIAELRQARFGGPTGYDQIIDDRIRTLEARIEGDG